MLQLSYVGAPETVNHQLQQAANRVAPKLGLPAVPVDGVIGPATVNLVNGIAGQHRIGALSFSPFTAATLERDAGDVVVALDAVWAALQPKQPTTTSTTTTTTEVFEPLTPQPKTKVIAGVIIGAAILGTGIAVMAAVRSAKHKQIVRGGPTRKVRR
jgi:hypothetical protein